MLHGDAETGYGTGHEMSATSQTLRSDVAFGPHFALGV